MACTILVKYLPDTIKYINHGKPDERDENDKLEFRRAEYPGILEFYNDIAKK